MFNKGMFDIAQGLYVHAICKYQSWGAKAIVRRLEIEMQQRFSSMHDLVGQGVPLNNNWTRILNDPNHCNDDSSGTRKRSTH